MSNRDRTYHGVSGKLTATAGNGPALTELLLKAASAMEDVPGCLCYVVGNDASEPDAVHVWEVWTDADAHQASLELPVFADLISQARPLLAGMQNWPDLVIRGGKASALA